MEHRLRWQGWFDTAWSRQRDLKATECNQPVLMPRRPPRDSYNEEHWKHICSWASFLMSVEQGGSFPCQQVAHADHGAIFTVPKATHMHSITCGIWNPTLREPKSHRVIQVCGHQCDLRPFGALSRAVCCSDAETLNFPSQSKSDQSSGTNARTKIRKKTQKVTKQGQKA